MNKLLVFGMVVTGLALLLAIISTAIPFWWRVTARGWAESINFGLFQSCRHTRSDTVCKSYSLLSDWLRAVQALMIMFNLALGTSLCLSATFAFLVKDKTMVALGAAFMAMAGGFMGLLGVLIYGIKMADPDDFVFSVLNGQLHAGFGTAVVAVVLALIAPVFIFMSRNSN